MFHIFEFLSQLIITQDRSSSCDDFVDRLNRKYTVILILIFVTVLTSKQYIGEPLACFCPAHFTGAHVEYTNNICWISKAFYVPIETSFSWSSTTTPIAPAVSPVPVNRNQLPDGEDLHFPLPNTSNMKFARVDNLIAYYPFLLIAQAILFYVPYFFWKNVINRSAYDIGTLIFIAYDSQHSETQTQREKTLRYLIRHIDRANEYYNSRNILSRNSLIKRLSHNNNNPSTSVKLNVEINNENSMHKRRVESFSNSFNKIINNFNIKRFQKKVNFDTKLKDAFSLNPESDKEKGYTPKKTYPHEETSSQFNKLLFSVYLIIKLFYILNCLGQFLILNKFISGETKSNNFYNENNEYMRNDITFMTNKSLWKGFEFGYKSVANLVQSGNLFGEKSRLLIFHTVIFCDFRIRMLGDRLHRHTVQCVVPVNIYTEKIFTILWFWLLFLNFVNMYNFVIWVTYYFSFKVRFNFIAKHLLKSNDLATATFHSRKVPNDQLADTNATFNLSKNELNSQLIDNMTKSYLLHDNVFIIKLISKNTNEMITRELVTLFLENFKRKCSLFYDENTV